MALQEELLPIYSMLLVLRAAALLHREEQKGPYRYRDPFVYRHQRFKLQSIPA